MLAQERLLTADEFADLPEPEDDSTYELVNGRLVRKPLVGNAHYVCGFRLAMALQAYAEGPGEGIAGMELYCQVASNPDTVRRPDAAYVAHTQLPGGKIPDCLSGAAVVMVEIKSKGQSEPALKRKVNVYFAAGARQVWVVRIPDRTLTIYHVGQPAELLTEDDDVTGGDVLPGFRYPLRRLFEGF